MRVHWTQDANNGIGNYTDRMPGSLADWEYLLWIEFHDYHSGAVICREEYYGSETIHKTPLNWTFG